MSSSERYMHGQTWDDNIHGAETTFWVAKDEPNKRRIPTSAHNVPLSLIPGWDGERYHGPSYPGLYAPSTTGHHPQGAQNSSATFASHPSPGRGALPGHRWGPEVLNTSPFPPLRTATPSSRARTLNHSNRSPSTSSRYSRLRDNNTPSPQAASFPVKLTTDVCDRPALYDESMTEIQAMTKMSGLLPRERWNRFEQILLPGSNTLSSSRLMQLLDWPVLQAAWRQFQRDVLEHHDATANPIHPPQWRIARAPSRIRTAASNTWRLLTGHEPADSSSDMGLPNARLLPNLLLPALRPQYQQHLSHTTTNPVNTTTLARWTGTGTTNPSNSPNPSNNPHHTPPRRHHWRRRTAQPPRECTVEDYYARFVLACVSGLYPPSSTPTCTSPAGSSPTSPSPCSSRCSSSLGGRGGGSRDDGGDCGGDGGSRDGGGEEKREEAWRDRLGWLRGEGGERMVVRRGVGEQVWIFFHVLYFIHCQFRREVLDGEGGWVKRVFGRLV